MKTLLLIGVLAAASSAVSAQKLNEKDVSPAMKDKIHSMYPEATKITWGKEKGNFEAEFKDKGVAMAVLFNPSAEVMESEVGITPDKLPTAVAAAVKAKFPHKKITEAAIIDTKGVKTYEAEVGGLDYIYDVEGKLLKTVKD